MLQFNSRKENTQTEQYTITLPYETRQKSRFKAQTDNGQEVSVILPRGTQLKHGDLLESENGDVAKVIAALEEVSIVQADDQYLLMRVCYHLGNRHVPLQIESNKVCYQKDHVLDDMVKGLGITPMSDVVAFEPESGAYSHH